MESRPMSVPIKTGLALNCGIRAAMVEHAPETAAYLKSLYLSLKKTKEAEEACQKNSLIQT